MSTKNSIARKIALNALIRFDNTHKDPAEIIKGLINGGISERDLSLAWEMTMGTIRYKKKLDFIAQHFIEAPIKKQKIEVLSAIRLGLYQMTNMSAVPDYAVVDATVSAAKAVMSKKEYGFVNAILRAALRKPDKVEYPDKMKDPVGFLSLFYSYPEWLVKRWLDRLGFADTEKLLINGNRRPKTYFKLVETRVDWKILLQELEDYEIDYCEGRYFHDYFSTADARKVMRLKSFQKGWLIIQDESQGIPLYLLSPPIGSHVLDLCAAPGGKTIALADRVGNKGKVTSVDFKRSKLSDLTDNVRRTGFDNITIVEIDVSSYEPNEKYEYILLDVPCSGLGTISNNADLRWTKSEKDIMILSEMQKSLLKKASELLADGGVLAYSTCTTEPEEIEDIVKSFVNNNPEFILEDGNSSLLEPFKVETGIYRSWPHRHEIGGGGFARLRKLK